MSRKNGRRVFSDKDGTKIKEDLQEISEEVKIFIIQVLADVREVGEDVLEYSIAFVNKVREVLAGFDGIDYEEIQEWANIVAQFAPEFGKWLTSKFPEIVQNIVGAAIDWIEDVEDANYWLQIFLEFVTSLTGAMQGGAWRALAAAVVTAKIGDSDFTPREVNLAVEACYNETA